jgi:hypothetical protein
VVVPVPVVLGVAMTVMNVVHVVAVRHGGVSAVRAVLVAVRLVSHVSARLALVPVARVLAVQVSVVRVVDVVAVRHFGVPAGRAVGVFVGCVFLVEGGHGSPSEGVWSVTPVRLAR